MLKNMERIERCGSLSCRFFCQQTIRCKKKDRICVLAFVEFSSVNQMIFQQEGTYIYVLAARLRQTLNNYKYLSNGQTRKSTNKNSCNS